MIHFCRKDIIKEPVGIHGIDEQHLIDCEEFLKSNLAIIRDVKRRRYVSKDGIKCSGISESLKFSYSSIEGVRPLSVPL